MSPAWAATWEAPAAGWGPLRLTPRQGLDGPWITREVTPEELVGGVKTSDAGAGGWNSAGSAAGSWGLCPLRVSQEGPERTSELCHPKADVRVAWADLVSLAWHFQPAPQVGKESHGHRNGAGS